MMINERSLIAVLAVMIQRSHIAVLGDDDTSLIAVLTTGMSKRAFVCFFLFSSGRLPTLRTVVISSQNVDGDNQRHPLLASCHAWENFSQNAELNVTPCNGAAIGHRTIPRNTCIPTGVQQTASTPMERRVADRPPAPSAP